MTYFQPAARLLLATGMLVAHAAGAAAVSVTVTDAAGQPLADAAVYAEPVSGTALPKPGRPPEIEQKGRQFIPLVSVVQAGSKVAFPNHDTVRHHVYSFSPAKVFELKLYSGVPSNPVLFDKPGTVVVGCNIHDQMLAYIHIVPTPWFGKTDAGGRVRLEGVPAGAYRLKAWHYGMPSGTVIPEQPLTLGATDLDAAFKLNSKAAAN